MERITLRDALYSGIMPGVVQWTLWVTRDQTYVGLMQVPGTRCTASQLPEPRLLGVKEKKKKNVGSEQGQLKGGTWLSALSPLSAHMP